MTNFIYLRGESSSFPEAAVEAFPFSLFIHVKKSSQKQTIHDSIIPV